MAIALLTTYLAGYRVPLYQRLHERHGVEVLCYGGGERYVPAWFSDLDAQLADAPFPARRLAGPREALAVGRSYDAVIAPFAGGAILPAAYAGARRRRRPFVLWASVWAQPRSAAHLLALPVSRHIYRHADAVVAYGEHVRRFVRTVRGRDDDVFVAPQSVEPELFAREVSDQEIEHFRAAHDLPPGPIVLYVGRLVPEKGVSVLLRAFAAVPGPATLVLIGDGPLAGQARAQGQAIEIFLSGGIELNLFQQGPAHRLQDVSFDLVLQPIGIDDQAAVVRQRDFLYGHIPCRFVDFDFRVVVDPSKAHPVKGFERIPAAAELCPVRQDVSRGALQRDFDVFAGHAGKPLHELINLGGTDVHGPPMITRECRDYTIIGG